jgi:hypothetical protein
MAKIQGPLHSDKASGLIGERIVFYQRKTGQKARFQKSQKDAKSFEQLRNREVYIDAICLWRKMTADERKPFNDEAKGRCLTGFNLFIKNYYMNTIRKLATLKNIDLTKTGEYVLYTVPSGCKLITMNLIIRVVAVKDLHGDGYFDLLRGSDNGIIVNGFPTGYFQEAESYVICGESEIYRPTAIVTAGDTAKFRVYDADSATTLIVDVDLIGYLIEA